MNIPRRPRNLFPVIRGSITAGVRWHKFSKRETREKTLCRYNSPETPPP